MDCPSCHTSNPPAARFCMSCGQALRAATPADDARHTRLAAAAPAPLAAKLRAVPDLAGENRVVTVLFADVVGSTALSDRLGAGVWTGVMNGAFERLVPAVYRYEGTIARLLGDTLVAFFGAPVAHEDDPVRAVRAALDLVAAAGDYAAEVRQTYGIDFAVRACLNTGPVVVGPVGADGKYDYTALEGAVNLAARLKFAAPPMSVVMTEATRRYVASLFDADDLGPIQVSGQDGPVRVYRVAGASASPGPVRGLAPAGLTSPMVGRAAELAALLNLCTAVRAGLGRAAVITGEAGLGKSRLIAEWKAAAGGIGGPAGLHWAEGRCLSYGRQMPYYLVADLVRSLLRLGPAGGDGQAALRDTEQELGPNLAPYLWHLLSLPIDGPALDRLRLLDAEALQAQYLAALRRLFTAQAARRPLVLVIEDLHWADPSSVELLIKLLPVALSSPVLYCLVTRPDTDAPGWRLVLAARETIGAGLTEISLAALSDADTRQMVANLLEVEALPEPVRRTILARAEGNPFFVEEVIRMLIDRGAVLRQGDRWVVGRDIDRVEIPDNLQGLLLARIDRLPDDVKRTLRVAAVIGRQFPVRILADVLDREQAE